MEGSVKTVGCNGMCHQEPLVEIVDGAGHVTLYGNVDTEETARRIIHTHLRPPALHDSREMDL